MKKVKLKLFPESSAIDSLLAKRHLADSGFNYSELESPILYRGDDRGPAIIFKEGFLRKSEKNAIPLPNITYNGESKSCIATTKDLVYAVGFADCPATVQQGGFAGFGFNFRMKASHGWVYMLFSEQGIDLTINSKIDDRNNKAKFVNEVVVTHVPAEHIIAAFQIKTTRNKISGYMDGFSRHHDVRGKNSSWQILCTKFEKNPNFSKDIDLSPYQKSVDEFLKVPDKGYFRIPWSLDEEEFDFPITHSMSDTEKEVYRMDLNLTPEQIKKLKSFQLHGLKLGFSVDDIQSEWFSNEHVSAFREGVAIKSLIGVSSERAQRLEKNLKSPFHQVVGYFFDRPSPKDNTSSNEVQITPPKI